MTKSLRLSLVGSLLGGLAVVWAQPVTIPPKLPAEAFGQHALYSEMQLAPDGRYVALVRDYEGRRSLHFAELESMALTRFELGYDGQGRRRREVGSFEWISDKRVVLVTVSGDFDTGFTAVNRDGKSWQPLSGSDSKPDGQDIFYARGTIFAFDDGKNTLMTSLHGEGNSLDFRHPDVVKMNTNTGRFEEIVKNPGDVVAWGTDSKGVVRLGVTAKDLNTGLIYRDKESAPWRTLLPPTRKAVQVLDFDATDQKFYVAAATATNRHGIFLFDPAAGVMGEPVLADPDYDLIAPEFDPSYDGVSLNTAVYSKAKRSVVGIRSMAEAPRVRWLDKEFAARQATLDRALPGTVNLIAGFSTDESKLLVLAYSDRDPGTYYLYDTKARGLRPLGARMPWIKPAEMAEMYPIKYSARDGLLIRGYLTLPVGRGQKNLPLIVMPHGGPWVRDAWEFEPWVQFLANRGYAVLQMNYRGSTGYGSEFLNKGKKEVGGAIQDDIEDGTRWAIAQGIADPQRVGILGASYGGYSTFFALGKNPDLYRCGVSIAGVSDWPDIFRSRDDEDSREAYLYWQEQIGDPKRDVARLKVISPANFADKMTAPLLIVQGERDKTVPPRQARLMAAALERAGHKPETLYLPDSTHNFLDEKEHIAMLERIDAFLAKHLPADAVSGVK